MQIAQPPIRRAERHQRLFHQTSESTTDLHAVAGQVALSSCSDAVFSGSSVVVPASRLIVAPRCPFARLSVVDAEELHLSRVDA
jgi:hypothetical protein